MAPAQELPFVTLDVFTTTPFKGNPLAVVTIPAGTSPKPTQAQKQTIAREFNLSETVFVHEDHADDKDPSIRHIDIFLTHSEVPFAGHPTIGTAVSLLSQGVSTLVTKAGPIPLVQLPGAGAEAGAGAGAVPGAVVQAAIPHNVHLHRATLASLPDDGFLPGDLSSVPEIRAAELAAPIFSIVRGMNFILIELPSLDLLAQVTRSSASFPLDRLLDPDWQLGFLGRYYFVRLSATPDAVTLRTRMVEATFEDPATGSAACCLSAYLTVVDPAAVAAASPDRSVRYDITQGVEIGRESNILVHVSAKEGKVDQVSLAGTAVQVMRGSVTV
jgi:predicted PhzF superfamily epimerase YddE/YHI9